jgi:prophage maintenance system killer protein
MTTEVSVVAIREAERVWDQVEQENQRLKDGAVRMIKHMAAGTIQKLIKRYCFITGWK